MHAGGPSTSMDVAVLDDLEDMLPQAEITSMRMHEALNLLMLHPAAPSWDIALTRPLVPGMYS